MYTGVHSCNLAPDFPPDFPPDGRVLIVRHGRCRVRSKRQETQPKGSHHILPFSLLFAVKNRPG